MRVSRKVASDLGRATACVDSAVLAAEAIREADTNCWVPERSQVETWVQLPSSTEIERRERKLRERLGPWPEGVQCPRCGSPRWRRWGRCGTGQPRFRCSACGRTFNPLTGTPLAYSKHRFRWPAFGRCLVEGLSVRKTAVVLGVAPSTAFRWRHRLLEPLVCSPRPILGGVVESLEAWYADCHKGERPLPRPPRRRGACTGIGLRYKAICILVARDGSGRCLVEDLGFGPPGPAALRYTLGTSLDRHSVLCTNDVHWYRRFARVARLPHRRGFILGQPWMVWVRGATEPFFAGYHSPWSDQWSLDGAARLRQRLRDWLARFRGVAARYLPRYLALFRHLEHGRWTAPRRQIDHPALPQTTEAGRRLLLEACAARLRKASPPWEPLPLGERPAFGW